jgi:hypothetical protein
MSATTAEQLRQSGVKQGFTGAEVPHQEQRITYFRQQRVVKRKRHGCPVAPDSAVSYGAPRAVQLTEGGEINGQVDGQMSAVKCFCLSGPQGDQQAGIFQKPEAVIPYLGQYIM